MATEAEGRGEGRGRSRPRTDGKPAGRGHALDHRQPHRRVLRGRDHRRDHPHDGPAPDQGQRGRLRDDGLRPGLHQHRLLPLGDHLHRRRGGGPPAPRHPDRAALREVDLPRGRLPADLRRAADRGPARALGLRRHPPHLRPRGHQEAERGLPPRRPPDGDAARLGRRAVDLLPRREGDRRRGGALHGGDPADRQDADAGRVRLSPQPRAPLRLSRQRAQLLRELPLDAVQDGEQLRARPAAGEGARRALHPPRRPRAELLDQRGARGRLLGRRSLLGGRGRRRRALRPAARRRQRGRAADAAPDRDAPTTSPTSSRASRTARRS